MKRRRSRVKVSLAETPEPPKQMRSHEVLAQLAAARPPNTNAHDTDQPTPCCVCGGPCERDSIHWGPWRRHARCEGLMAYEPARIEAACRALAIPLDTDADLVPYTVPNYSTTHAEPTWDPDEPTRTRLPWRHIDRAGLAAAVARLPELRADAGRVPTYCESGQCAWCGALEARGWADRGHRWADGSPAPLCGPCSRIYDRAGEPDPTWWAGQRDAIAEAITGVPIMMGEAAPPGLAGFAEGEEPSDGSPWSHLPAEAVEAYRWDRWGRYGGRYAPPERRTEALVRAQAADAAKAARMAAIEAEKVAKADVYGFAGGVR